MKHLKYIFYLIISLSLLVACSEDDLNETSIFDTETPELNDFDKWIRANYTEPYNINILYQFEDKESDNTYNLVPAKYENSVAMAKLIKHLWVDAYGELIGDDFLKEYSPRLFQFIGSPAYNSSGSIVLGTAEGGLKVTLFNVNMIDVEDPDLDQLNYWYFKTMHHEFSHILHQTKSYTTDFNEISASDYMSGSWLNLTEKQALEKGFISSYGSSETQEDFVELIATFVTNTPEHWEGLLETAGYGPDENDPENFPPDTPDGALKILEKFSIVQDYLLVEWEIDIVKLREIVMRRTAEVADMDLKNLN